MAAAKFNPPSAATFVIPKAKTNWHLMIWPTLALWGIAYVYVQHSEFKTEAALILPILMVGALFIVAVINAIIGSHQQHRLMLQAIDAAVTCCSECGCANTRLVALDIHAYAYIVVWFIQFNRRGRFCGECARRLATRAFWKTCFYSILFPPIILWAWIEKRSIMRRFSATAS